MTGLLLFFLALAIGGLALLGFFTLQFYFKSEQMRGACEDWQKQYDEDQKTLKSQQAELYRLSRYRGIADADAKASEMLSTAQSTLERAKLDASATLIAAQTRADSLVKEANEKAANEVISAREAANIVLSEANAKIKAQKEETQALLNSSTTHASKIIAAANKRAEQIAGSAYEALKNAKLYEQAAKAMKHLVDGYGNEYIVPTSSLLDELADDFSYAQAGRELKRAREFTKTMARNGTAGDCGYTETNRRANAINFVVDAFNGKVDSILSRVKHDNVGTLAQRIRDAFSLVNVNGQAFREARITQQYLAARLEELKWAARVQEIAQRERDEQRHAMEQAREEARAAKERERALRDAAKEEEILQKAMAEAREQFERATGQQKTMYEERLKEMAEKLNEAMERKDRARSMAEQTKKGHVYIISNVGSFGEGVFKIGLTRRWDPKDRVDELGGASVPFGFDVHATILSDDAPALETQLHERFRLRQINKVNFRKEFFRVSLKEIREEIEKLDITTGVSWTETAHAREYYESLAIEKEITDKPDAQERWMKRQLNMRVAMTEGSRSSGELEDEE